MSETKAEAAKAVAKTEAEAVVDARDQVVHFAEPLAGSQARPGKDAPVKVLAFGSGGGGRFLVKHDDDTLAWVPTDRISIGA